MYNKLKMLRNVPKVRVATGTLQQNRTFRRLSIQVRNCHPTLFQKKVRPLRQSRMK